MRERIGECLLQAGLISDADLRRALDERRRTGERLGAALVRLQLASEEEIAQALARQLGLAYVDLSSETPDPTAATLIPRDIALQHECIGVWRESHVLTVAMADPLRFSLVHELESTTGHRINVVVATASAILAAVATCYPAGERDHVRAAEPDEGVELADLTPDVGELAAGLLGRAVREGATDIHVDPVENGVEIRLRVNGALGQPTLLPKTAHEALIAHLKSMAGMDVAETRLPQDGRIRFADRRGVDFRLSTIRTLFGERAVLRRLTPQAAHLSLEDLGMSPIALDALRACLRQERGLVVVCGPARSGRTTTAVAALTDICAEGRTVVTIEDPIEYVVAGAQQTAVDAVAGRQTFASAARAAAAQDADALFIGELRDRETAAIAFDAARSRLVLSTLVCDDRQSAVEWLNGAGMESPRTLVATVTQRLVRRLCDRCGEPSEADADTRRKLEISDVDQAFTMYAAAGCDACGHTGYRGRIGLFEVMRGGSVASTMPTLVEDGLSKVKSGMTSAAELLRVVAQVRDARAVCGACGAPTAGDYAACPNCGRPLGVPCPHCGRTLQAEWNFCPYCIRSTSEGRDNKGSGRNPVRGFNV